MDTNVGSGSGQTMHGVDSPPRSEADAVWQCQCQCQSQFRSAAGFSATRIFTQPTQSAVGLSSNTSHPRSTIRQPDAAIVRRARLCNANSDLL